jgi:iron(III) transport system permease protein
LVGLLFLFPTGYLVWGTLTLGGDFWATLTSEQTLRPLFNSVLIASATAAACAVLGTMLALLVIRTDLPGRRIWRLVLAMPLAIPSFVGATALLSAFGPGGLVPFLPRVQGFWGAFLVLTLLSYPYVYLPVLARLSATSSSLEEAARLLGGRPSMNIVRVLLPQARNTIAAGTMLVFLYALSDFGAVALMRFDTITRAIFSARLFDQATSLTLGLVLAMLALLVLALERAAVSARQVAKDLGGRQLLYPLGRLKVPALGVVGLVVGSALVVPIAVFALWVVRGSATVGIGFSGLGDGLGFLMGPAVNSAVVAAVAGVIAVVVVFPVAFASARRRSWVTEAAATAVASVFALPGLVVALAVVFWAIKAPGPLAVFYQSFPLLILGYVLHFGAQAMRASAAAVADVPIRYDDAARTLGVGARRRFLTIELPLIFPGLIVGGGLVLLSTLKELPATLLLAPIGFQTLATRIWSATEDGFYAEVGVTSLVLIFVSTSLTWFLILKPELRTTDRS